MSIGTNERPATIVSSPLRPTGQNRAWVRPHAHGCLVIRMMSSERKRTIGVTGLSSEVATSSPSSPSATWRLPAAPGRVDGLEQHAVLPGVAAVVLAAFPRAGDVSGGGPQEDLHAPAFQLLPGPRAERLAREAAPLNEENTSRMSVVRLRWSSSASASPVSCA